MASMINSCRASRRYTNSLQARSREQVSSGYMSMSVLGLDGSTGAWAGPALGWGSCLASHERRLQLCRASSRDSKGLGMGWQVPQYSLQQLDQCETIPHNQMSIRCGPEGSCPFLYECTRKLVCEHKPIFPISGYEYGIFALFPICSAICNLSGNSFGEFKVLMLMDLLNYQENKATTLAYPLITGTALFNFFDLIPKRHPSRDTSLIDYNVVLIIIPNILFGSTIGSLVNKFIPPIVADSIIIPIMIGFSIKFYLRYRNFKREEQQAKHQQPSRDSHRDIQVQLTEADPPNLDATPIEEGMGKVQLQLKIEGHEPSNLAKSEELVKLQAYESGLHLPHVLATIAIFLVFETLSFLVQGKIIPFSICSQQYPIGMSVLTVLFVLFDLAMFKYTDRQVRFYERVGYPYSLRLNVPRLYLLMCVGAFLGGFNGGVFGIGNSTTVIFTLLYMDMEPAVVSATVGYQVVFAGSASLAQAFATDEIAGNVALLFFLETFIIGGVLSFGAKRLVGGFSALKVKICLMLVIFGLVTCSVFALIASIVLGYLQFGAANMQDVPFHC